MTHESFESLSTSPSPAREVRTMRDVTTTPPEPPAEQTAVVEPEAPTAISPYAKVMYMVEREPWVYDDLERKIFDGLQRTNSLTTALARVASTEAASPAMMAKGRVPSSYDVALAARNPKPRLRPRRLQTCRSPRTSRATLTSPSK